MIFKCPHWGFENTLYRVLSLQNNMPAQPFTRFPPPHNKGPDIIKGSGDVYYWKWTFGAQEFKMRIGQNRLKVKKYDWCDVRFA